MEEMSTEWKILRAEFPRIHDTAWWGLYYYLTRGFHPGDWLVAVLAGELFQAVALADEESIRSLPSIVRLLDSYALECSFRERGKVIHWMRSRVGRNRDSLGLRSGAAAQLRSLSSATSSS